jgi:hypothetical protein
LVESKPVRIGALEFTAVVEQGWELRSRYQQLPVEIQLYIVNRGDKLLLFPLFDTFSIVIKDSNGTEITVGGGRDATIFVKPVLLPPGGRYCLCRVAYMDWDLERKWAQLRYFDGTGTCDNYCFTGTGTYQLQFRLRSAPNRQLDEVLKRAADAAPANIPEWYGECVTKAVVFKVITLPEPQQIK